MIPKSSTLMFDSVRGIDKQIHLLLQQKYLWERTTESNEPEILILLPLRINFLLSTQTKSLFSVEMMQQIRFSNQEIISLQHFALQKKLPTLDALLALIKEIVLNDQNTKTIIERYQVKKKQIVVNVEVWKDLVIQV